ncbi:class I SAM-dependent methyltransferase [Deinococcus sp. KNUC1210]|uniref:class I SAM-dependent rRNA methyltransferase n=1 Tax=Deinococcus sp. KNUC1210 TaxID=2917691 RepID=UPI001EF0AD9A|nr:class I SAM-dependent methyltransferase [Deinococcus sp. KNUC1210]ULH16838.1 class I SAM-dependent methyltransferase [Deinococcus sp. KNUC1210]
MAAARATLPANGTTLYRAAHTTETAGLYSLDVAGSVGILSLYREQSAAQESELAELCAETLHLDSVYLKRRPQEARHAANVQRQELAPPGPVWGAAQPEVTALEDGVPFLIRPGGDLSTGLFTDARPARRWVRTHAAGRVLNTFAYTCGFGLSAALAGANSVKNLDLSRKVLNWGQENYALSGLPAPDTDFISGDVFDWLSRFERRGERFDLLILDPPSFARSKSGVWRSERDYPRLAAQAAALLEPGGWLMAMNNHAGVSAQQFARMLRQGAPTITIVQQFGAGEDYPGADHLKVMVGRL